MRAFLAIYLATLRQFLRDRMAFLFTMLLPLLMAAFFGMIFANEPAYHLTLGLAVEDDGPVGAAVVQALEAPALASTLSLRRGSPAEIRQAVESGDLPLGLLLPPDLSANAAANRPTPVTLLHDRSRQQTAGPGMAIIRQVLQELNLALSGANPLLQVEEAALASRQIPSAHLYIPGMLALGILWLGMFGTAPPLVQMREQGALRRVAATPLRRSTLLAGQVAFRVTTGMLQAALLLGYGLIAYDLKVATNWLLVIAMALLGTLLFVTLGYLVASLGKSTESVVAIGQVIQFPMMFLSGVLFPMEALPDFLRPLSSALPLTYLGDGLRQTLLGAPPLYPLWLDFTVLGGLLLLLAALAVRFFRWE